ncbi:hypothetical protein CYMTET_26664 [Cymbomonas tetramitiformis]|uniref:Photosynthesis system II assembly factor Ycf48/Hcf136-like domain-containing protein n=1 Tax=Cymbomonas tetramitiformis TaxID=36881 RepID=A0AAE0FRL6_9CHLO|nr:hypothetical protein CYMTET_26664 [Cymbomonas tetramitiformis]
MQMFVRKVLLLLLTLEPCCSSNWRVQDTETSEGLYDVSFVTSELGWAVGSDGAILRTSDSGSSWLLQYQGKQVSWRSVSFASSTVGWAVGGSLSILYTDSAGERWAYQQHIYGDSGIFTAVQAVTSLLTWVVSDDGGIFRSIDGGKTWGLQYQVSTHTPPKMCVMRHGYA